MALDRDVEFVAAVAVDVFDEDLLRVAVAEVAVLAAAVHPVGFARGRVDLQNAVIVDVADLDLVHEGVGLFVELDHVEAAVGLRPQHRHDALIVRRNRNGRRDHQKTDYICAKRGHSGRLRFSSPLSGAASSPEKIFNSIAVVSCSTVAFSE